MRLSTPAFKKIFSIFPSKTERKKRVYSTSGGCQKVIFFTQNSSFKNPSSVTTKERKFTTFIFIDRFEKKLILIVKL
jgi:hypothetical protein